MVVGSVVVVVGSVVVVVGSEEGADGLQALSHNAQSDENRNNEPVVVVVGSVVVVVGSERKTVFRLSHKNAE